MKILVERITDVRKDGVVKQPVAAVRADILPVAIGDDLWIIVGGKRERYIAVDVRMAVETDNDLQVAIIDVAKPDVARTLDRAKLTKLRGDVESPPDVS